MSTDSRFEHPSNIFAIPLLPEHVVRLDRLAEVNDVHPLNAYDAEWVFVTVFRFERFIPVIFAQF